MILVHAPDGNPIMVNPDLIETITVTPETVLTLVGGRRVTLSDSPEWVAERTIQYRASVLAEADRREVGARDRLRLLGRLKP